MKPDAKPQMGKPGIIALVALISAAPPIATDLFLPALPDMPIYFGTTEAVANLVLVAFFFFLAIGMLIAGPLSDKYGRRPLIFVSLGLFATASMLGALVPNIWILIALRVLQGLGGGGMVALGTALVKDCFEGQAMQRVLVVTMAISVVAPMCAPVLGAVILSFTTWQGTFVAQGLFALAAVPMAIRLKEPLPAHMRTNTGIGATFGRLLVVGSNKGFLFLLVVCALFGAPYMTYISSASYIYMDFFALDKVSYSLFFAANAALTAVGAVLVAFAGSKFRARITIPLCFAIGAVGGVLTLTVAGMSPLVFLAGYGLYTLGQGFIRPIGTAVLLEQQQGDTGSASSLINTVNTVLGSLGMVAATLPWSTYVSGLGVCVTGASVLALAGFFLLSKSPFKVKGL